MGIAKFLCGTELDLPTCHSRRQSAVEFLERVENFNNFQDAKRRRNSTGVMYSVFPVVTPHPDSAVIMPDRSARASELVPIFEAGLGSSAIGSTPEGLSYCRSTRSSLGTLQAKKRTSFPKPLVAEKEETPSAKSTKKKRNSLATKSSSRAGVSRRRASMVVRSSRPTKGKRRRSVVKVPVTVKKAPGRKRRRSTRSRRRTNSLTVSTELSGQLV